MCVCKQLKPMDYSQAARATCTVCVWGEWGRERDSIMGSEGGVVVQWWRGGGKYGVGQLTICMELIRM